MRTYYIVYNLYSITYKFEQRILKSVKLNPASNEQSKTFGTNKLASFDHNPIIRFANCIMSKLITRYKCLEKKILSHKYVL